jgi:septal ring factor EnvC (AmiA/AmiB activator)
MESINGLLKALDNKVPASMAKRLDGLQKLNVKLESARKENNENPTEESKEILEEIEEFLNDTQEDIIEDLEVLVEQKNSANLKARQESEARERQARERQAISQKEARERQARERQAKEKQELEKKQLEEEALKSGEKTNTEKKSGIGWGSLLLGGALLVMTGGAIKYFGNKK